MKKYIVFFILFLVCLNTYCQKKGKFIEGAKIISNNEIKKVDSINSILFSFEGSTHTITYYLDLTENLKFKFLMSQANIAFDYNLSSRKPLKHDLNSIPKKKYNANNFEYICSIKITKKKGWDNHLIKKRKQNYNLNIELKKNATNEIVETAIINVNSYYTILTQNNNSSRLIYQILNN